MSKVVVKGMLDPASQAWVHASHFLDLYLSFFRELVEAEKNKESEELDPLFNEFGQVYASWATEEAFKVGLVTVYHHWEKCIKKLMSEQAEEQGLALLKNTTRLSFVEHTKLNLEAVFDCVVDSNVWEIIDEAREIVNCFKHGTSDKFHKLYSLYPSYFDFSNTERVTDYSDHFILGAERFERLGNNILEFWETLPREYVWS